MSRIVQTFWTKPMKNIYQSLRLAYASAKSIKAQGYELIMYTDSRGAELLKDFPYDEIIVLDELKNINHGLFCAIKYLSLEKEPIGSIHVDFDVIIDKPVIQWESNMDVITQNEEEKTKYTKHKNFVISSLKNKDLLFLNKEYIDNEYFTPYCCGVIGFNNIELKNTFLNGYKEALECFNDINVPNDIIVDFIFEQTYISYLTKKGNYKPQFISADYEESLKCYKIIDGCRYYKTDGYIHLYGKSKFTCRAQEIINTLLTINDIKIINKNFIKEEINHE